ncbi:MAG: YncE family protein [Deltaproteobacteria bacterium]|nr:YncE family protein [Deltaproteobacteria bacterium]MBI3386638.1 YncE family protein [Deltaproteobacteria bacterium]
MECNGLPSEAFFFLLCLQRDESFNSVLRRAIWLPALPRTAVVAAIFSITLHGLCRTASANPFAYVADNRDGQKGQIRVVDVATNTVVASIPQDWWRVDDIVFTPSGRFGYVLQLSALSLLDGRSNTFVNEAFVGAAKRAAITPDARFVYLASSWYEGWPEHHVVSVMETATDTIVASIPVADEPYAIAITSDGRSAYVPACKYHCDHLSGGEVYVLDTTTEQLAATIGGVGPGEIALSPDGAFAYATSIVGYSCAFSSGCSASLSIISTATNTVRATVTLPAPDFPAGIAVTPDGRSVYVTLTWPDVGTDRVAVIDAATATLAATITLPDGSFPEGIAITPEGRSAYVANRASQSLAVIDTATNTITSNIPLCDSAVDCWPSRIAIASVPSSTTECEPNTICLAVGSATVTPGATRSVGVTLTNAGNDVAGTQNDLTFSAGASIAANPGGRPDCQPNAHLGLSGTAFAFVPATCTPGVDCTSVRILVFSFDDAAPIPDGSLLYTCNVKIADDLAAGTYPLRISNVVASDQFGQRLKAMGADGAIVVPPSRIPNTSEASTGASLNAAGGCQTGGGGDRPWTLLLPAVLALVARWRRNQSSHALRSDKAPTAEVNALDSRDPTWAALEVAVQSLLAGPRSYGESGRAHA